MATTERYNSFKEFYPFYLSQHANRSNRNLHFIGTGLVIFLFVLFLYTLNWKYFALIPLAGYGFAWFGHFTIEKNKPATFKYPLYSLASDFVMFWHICTRQITKKIEEAKNKL